MPTNRLPPVHPGEILQDDFLVPLGLSGNALARALRVPPNRITAILGGKRAISGDTALRLARYFGTSAQLWMNLQAAYDLKVAEAELGQVVEQEVIPHEKAA